MSLYYYSFPSSSNLSGVYDQSVDKALINTDPYAAYCYPSLINTSSYNAYYHPSIINALTSSNFYYPNLIVGLTCQYPTPLGACNFSNHIDTGAPRPEEVDTKRKLEMEIKELKYKESVRTWCVNDEALNSIPNLFEDKEKEDDWEFLET